MRPLHIRFLLQLQKKKHQTNFGRFIYVLHITKASMDPSITGFPLLHLHLHSHLHLPTMNIITKKIVIISDDSSPSIIMTILFTDDNHDNHNHGNDYINSGLHLLCSIPYVIVIIIIIMIIGMMIRTYTQTCLFYICSTFVDDEYDDQENCHHHP